MTEEQLKHFLKPENLEELHIYVGDMLKEEKILQEVK